MKDSLSRKEDSAEASSAARLDRWLWAVRVFKTRPLATDACRRSRIEINGLPAKPGRPVHAGETLSIRLEIMTRTLRVTAVPPSRVGPKLVKEFCVDLTPAVEIERLRQHQLGRVVPREAGSGRPTKRDRRILDQLLS